MSENAIDRLASASAAICVALAVTAIASVMGLVFNNDPWHVNVGFVFALLLGHLYRDLRR